MVNGPHLKEMQNDRFLLDGSIPGVGIPQAKDSRRSKFTEFEDEKLKQIVMSMPKVNWKIVERVMGTKTARQCRERYNNYLAPEVNTNPWTPEEEQLLIEKYKEFGPQWSKMTSFFRNRAAVSLKNQYAKLVYNGKKQTNRGCEPQQVNRTDNDITTHTEPEPEPCANEKPVESVAQSGIHEAIANILATTDRMGDAWYSVEEIAKYSSIVHGGQEDEP